jgi:class 3 adenylate cyclase
MSETLTLFAVLRQSADAETVDLIEGLVRDAPDAALCRINVLDLAKQAHLDEERVITGFLHAARLGIFELSWNLLCTSCGGVLAMGPTLKTFDRSDYTCAFCAAHYEARLDETVEVTFTVGPRVRKIAAHEPHDLPIADYYRQVFFSSGVDLPDNFDTLFHEITFDWVELPAGEKALLSLQLPAGTAIVFDPVTHATQFIEVKGEPTAERQSQTLIFSNERLPTETVQLRPGPLRLGLENHAEVRVLPTVWNASCPAAHELLTRRRRFLTAKRLLTNQTFRDIYRTDTLSIDQRLKITSLTFLFTDLKSSTELYERVGDLVAFDLVQAHFRMLNRIVVSEAGAIVKTIGDAVMATFPTPDRAVSAALRMREGMKDLNAERQRDDLQLKIGIHEGPCLAVLLNDRQDYFGQTVNIAARVQGLAMSRAIYATGAVVDHPEAALLLEKGGLKLVQQKGVLRGIPEEVPVFEIP